VHCKSNLKHLLLISTVLLICQVAFGQDEMFFPEYGDCKYQYQERIITAKEVKGYIVRDSLLSTKKIDTCTVSGNVKDASHNQEPIPFVQILFENRSGIRFSAVTDFDGKYNVKLPPDTFSVSFRYLPSGTFATYTIVDYIIKSGEHKQLDIAMGTPTRLKYLTVGSDSLLNLEDQVKLFNEIRQEYLKTGAWDEIEKQRPANIIYGK
jgi:hypothetical protein